MSVLTKGVEWDGEKMGSYSVEDYGKMSFPARVAVRKQSGGLFDLGMFETAEALGAYFKANGLLWECDRVCYYK